jgi:hypothetical protein
MPSAVLRTCAAVASVCLAAAIANPHQNETAGPRIWLAVEEQPRGRLRIEPIATVDDGQLTRVQSSCLSDERDSQDPATDILKPGQTYSLLFGGANIGEGLITEESQSERIAYVKYTGTAKIRGQVRALATNIQQSGFRVALRETATADDRRSALALAREIFSKHGVPEAYLAKVRAEYLTRTYLAPSPQASLLGSFYIDTQNDEALLHSLFFIAGEPGDKLQPELTWLHISENESDEERMRLVDHADLFGNGQDEVVGKQVSVQTQSHRYVIFRRTKDTAHWEQFFATEPLGCGS